MVYLPFEDRLEAGRMLAAELSHLKAAHDGVVLALTRGGVPVGFEVAELLGLPLDIVVARKLGVPWQPELAMGAIAGTARILDEPMIEELGIDAEDVDEIVAHEQAEMLRRESVYRADRPADDLHGKTAILVDDGLATGSTMLAAVRHVRNMKPARVIVGVPVASKQACDLVRRNVDDLICLAVPETFIAVGEWYRDFDQVNDIEVRRLLAESRSRQRAMSMAVR